MKGNREEALRQFQLWVDYASGNSMLVYDALFSLKTISDEAVKQFIDEKLSRNKPHSKRSEIQKVIEQTRALTNPERQRIVCAAILTSDGTIFTGIRHYSPDMLMQMELAGYTGAKSAGAVQGFVDQWFNFLTREQAFDIAVKQGQYNPNDNDVSKHYGKLFSEDLY